MPGSKDAPPSAASAAPEGSKADGDPADEVRMSLGEHLGELRARLILCIAAVVLAAVVVWLLFDPLYRIVRQPIDDYNATAAPAERVTFLAQRILDPFTFVVKLGLWGGLVLASPLIALEAWRFASPGLYQGERRAIVPAFVLGAGLFAGGAFFAYRFVMPTVVSFLVPYGRMVGAEVKLDPGGYLDFFLAIHFAFGLAFETPLVTAVLAWLGLVTARGLARRWRYAVAGAFILGAFLTPPDAASQVLMAGCLIALYVVSIGLARLVGSAPAAPGGGQAGDEEGGRG